MSRLWRRGDRRYPHQKTDFDAWFGSPILGVYCLGLRSVRKKDFSLGGLDPTEPVPRSLIRQLMAARYLVGQIDQVCRPLLRANSLKPFPGLSRPVRWPHRHARR